MKPKWDKWVSRLKLYNNQKRDEKAVGDPLMFTTFNTVFSSLYDDKLQQKFEPVEEGDEETAELVTKLSEHDYAVMELDYPVFHDAQWDALFFSRSIIDMSEFDREDDKTTVPRVIDPLTMFRDPNAVSVRGYKGRGALRFFGYEIAMTRFEIDEMDDFMHKDKVTKNNTTTEVQNNHQMRQSAMGYDQTTRESYDVIGANEEYLFNVWYTRYQGKLVRIHTDLEFTKVFKIKVWDDRKFFPLADFCVNPIPNSWDGVSIPDLIEDKQRHRASVINSSLRTVKFAGNPSYLFDVNRVDKNNIAKTEFGNLIPVDGAPSGVVSPLPRESVKADVQWILDVLDGAAQRSTATPEIQQGVNTKSERTLGENQLVASRVDTRYSLTAKIFATGFRRFWQLWYMNYKEYFAKDIDSKTIRISGVNGARTRKLTRENIVSEVDPDVFVESKAISDARKFNELNSFMAFHANASKDPGYNYRGAMKYMANLADIDTDRFNILFHKTTDEIEAENENKFLADEKLVDKDGKAFFSIMQDHDTHMEMHAKAPETKAKAAHILAHEKAKLMIRDNPEVAAMIQQKDMNMNNQDNPNDASFAASAGKSTSEMQTEVSTNPQ